MNNIDKNSDGVFKPLSEPEITKKFSNGIVNNALSIAFDAINSSAGGIIITNREGNIRFANPSFCKMFSYEPSNIIGKNAADWFYTKEIRKFSLELKDYLAVLHLKDGYAVSEMKVEQSDWILDKTLSDAALAQEGALILGIVRKDGSYIGTPYADTKNLPDDVLILYGHIDRLKDLDQRRKGKKGEKAHKKAVSEHLEEIKEMETVISNDDK